MGFKDGFGALGSSGRIGEQPEERSIVTAGIFASEIEKVTVANKNLCLRHELQKNMKSP
jgi:hypothetical protein